MDVCHSRSYFSFNFDEQCLNNTDNNWLNGSEIFHKDVENHFKNNGFLLSVGFVVALMLETEIVRQKFQTATRILKSNELKNSILAKLISLFCLFVSLIISPLIFIIFSICITYRSTVHLILKHKFGQRYIGLLEGTDVVWAIEDVSKSIINILAIINIENIEEFKDCLTEKLTKLIEDKKFAKLKYYRQKSYGYYFWAENNFNVTNNINYLKTVESQEENCLNKEELLKLISEYSNKLLPENHTTSWEILIGKQKLKSEENENNFPILFRFHHSVGDGIALIKILLEAADDQTNELEKHIKLNDRKDKTITTIIKLKLLSFFQTLLSIIFVPGHLIQINLMKSIDDSILHGKALTGMKTLAWISENDDFPILKTIKYIKSKFPEVSFLDVVLTGLSEAFSGYFEQKTSEIPSSVTAVILERVDKICLAEYSSFDSCQLQNRFSVGMVNLPILPRPSPAPGIYPGGSGVDTNDPGTGCDFVAVARLQEVNRETSLLKNASPDYQINYWLLKVVSKLLPEPILRPMLHSAHSTMVVSNILGPDEITICNGHLIKDLIFWLPHRGLTGIGISVISYAGKLQIGITADKALISETQDAELILQNFVNSLKLFSDKLIK